MKDNIEHHQTIIYAITIAFATLLGTLYDISSLNQLLPLTLGILMFAMFLQVPLTDLAQSMQNRSFISALLISNYGVVPCLTALLILFLPDHPAILFSVLLVLLTPCIDYVVVFTSIGKGDAKLMLAATPMLLITQLMLLPIFIWLFMGSSFLTTLSITPFVESFLFLILLPFAAAVLVQKTSHRNAFMTKVHQLSNWLPVPFMALVLFIIVASQMTYIINDPSLLTTVVPIYIAFMVIMLPLNYLIGSFFKLSSPTKRTLIYSAGTRNSLAVLPFALALPSEMATIATTVIVTQTIVELLGELIYIKITPHIS